MKERTEFKRKKKVFKPFVFNFPVPDEKEARLLYHVLNTYNLLDNLKAIEGYGMNDYDPDIAPHFSTQERDFILTKLNEQGFAI